jgi:hypothetical protein
MNFSSNDGLFVPSEALKAPVGVILMHFTLDAYSPTGTGVMLVEQSGWSENDMLSVPSDRLMKL